jgi:hypothetical protein
MTMVPQRQNFERLLRLTALALIFFCNASPLSASQYYFSATGNDQTGNGSQLNPWRSITKFNTLDLNPGDSAYFRAGDVFHGSLLLDASDTGTDAVGNLIAPITISSYGGTNGQRAEIDSAPNSEGFLAVDDGGIELKNLELSNGGSFASNLTSGIQFLLDSSASATSGVLQHIYIDNVVSHGFHSSGLALDSQTNVGYQDVRVTNSEFYNNQFAGLEIGASQYNQLVNRNVVVDHVSAHDNPGFNGCNPHCGHGIVVGQTDGAVIQNSTANSNGLVAGKGNVGIWTWQSNNVVIQHNSASGNRSPLGGDGGGFDLDGGATNSIVQYNTSQDNAGAGYLLAQFAFASPMQQNVFRYNLSLNDGTDGYGGITVSGDSATDQATSAVFHNNTVIIDHKVTPNSRGPVWFVNGSYNDISLINNALIALNGAALIDGPVSSNQAKFTNNAYWTASSPIVVNGIGYANVAAWAAATQQEMLNGHFAGIQADPMIAAGSTYRPAPPSVLIDAGLSPGSAPWPAWLTDLGPIDLAGVPIPQGARADVGAAEYASLAGDYNGDGIVDARDYVLWRNSNGASGIGLPADGDHNGMVDAADYEIWRSNFGQSVLHGTALAVGHGLEAVPEANIYLQLFVLFAISMILRPARNLVRCRMPVHISNAEEYRAP